MQLRVKLGKQILILIDDTDKVPPEIGLKLFYENGHHLAAPKACIVYVIDISIATSSKFAAIRGKFGAESFFPAIKVRPKSGTEDKATKRNRAMLAELVQRRMPPEAIAKEALQDAIDLTGGVVRELIRLLQYAVFEAKGPINRRHVEHARYKIANEYNLYGHHTRILRQILADPDWLAKTEDQSAIEGILSELLHMPALFQYRNGDVKWYRPYPVFNEYLAKLTPPVIDV